MGGWMDGWMDGWIDGWMGGWMYRILNIISYGLGPEVIQAMSVERLAEWNRRIES